MLLALAVVVQNSLLRHARVTIYHKKSVPPRQLKSGWAQNVAHSCFNLRRGHHIIRVFLRFRFHGYAVISKEGNRCLIRRHAKLRIERVNIRNAWTPR